MAKKCWGQATTLPYTSYDWKYHGKTVPPSNCTHTFLQPIKHNAYKSPRVYSQWYCHFRHVFSSDNLLLPRNTSSLDWRRDFFSVQWKTDLCVILRRRKIVASMGVPFPISATWRTLVILTADCLHCWHWCTDG